MNKLINRCLVSFALSCFCVSLPLTATAVVPESLSVYSTAIAFLLGIIGLKKAQPS